MTSGVKLRVKTSISLSQYLVTILPFNAEGVYLPDMIKSSERGHAASGNGNNAGRVYADQLKS